MLTHLMCWCDQHDVLSFLLALPAESGPMALDTAPVGEFMTVLKHKEDNKATYSSAEADTLLMLCARSNAPKCTRGVCLLHRSPHCIQAYALCACGLCTTQKHVSVYMLSNMLITQLRAHKLYESFDAVCSNSLLPRMFFVTRVCACWSDPRVHLFVSAAATLDAACGAN